MSLEADREALSGALTGQPGITSTSAYAPSAPKPGSVWTVLRSVPVNTVGFGQTAEWSVIIVLPQNLGQADAMMDAGLLAWMDALRPHMSVTEAAPVNVQVGTGNTTLPAVSIAGRRELT